MRGTSTARRRCRWPSVTTDGDEDTSTVDQSRSVNMSIDLVDAGDAVDQDAVTSDAADDSHPNQHRYVCVCACVRA